VVIICGCIWRRVVETQEFTAKTSSYLDLIALEVHNMPKYYLRTYCEIKVLYFMHHERDNNILKLFLNQIYICQSFDQR